MAAGRSRKCLPLPEGKAAELQHIGPLLPEQVQTGSQCAGQQQVVGINKENVFAPGTLHAAVARIAGGQAGRVGKQDFIVSPLLCLLGAYGMETLLEQRSGGTAVKGNDDGEEKRHGEEWLMVNGE